MSAGEIWFMVFAIYSSIVTGLLVIALSGNADLARANRRMAGELRKLLGVIGHG